MAVITRYHTQWAAQFYTAAELSRRGYTVALTLGNAPGADLFARSPRGTDFVVQAKGLQRRGDWRMRQPRSTDPALYILVAVPAGERAQAGKARFFLLSQAEVRARMGAYLRARRRRRTPKATWQPAIRWQDATPHENRWDKLPS